MRKERVGDQSPGWSGKNYPEEKKKREGFTDENENHQFMLMFEINIFPHPRQNDECPFDYTTRKELCIVDSLISLIAFSATNLFQRKQRGLLAIFWSFTFRIVRVH